jgi:hypothetical protein
MQEQEKTPWFSGDEKPVREGVYERDYSDEQDGSFALFCRWNGWSWFCGYGTVHSALCTSAVAPCQSFPWRGLVAESGAHRE